MTHSEKERREIRGKPRIKVLDKRQNSAFIPRCKGNNPHDIADNRQEGRQVDAWMDGLVGGWVDR